MSSRGWAKPLIRIDVYDGRGLKLKARENHERLLRN
jgi:hypothetical protein